VRKRGGTPFRQIFWSRNGSPANIVANHVVLVRLTLDQFIFWPKLPPNAGFCIKNLRKKISGGDTPEPPQPEGATPSRTHSQHGYRPCAGRKLPRCWDLGLGNRSPKSKFTTTPLMTARQHHAKPCSSVAYVSRYSRIAACRSRARIFPPGCGSSSPVDRARSNRFFTRKHTARHVRGSSSLQNPTHDLTNPTHHLTNRSQLYPSSGPS